MAAIDINSLKSALTYGGARQALFYVFLNNPVDNSADQKFPLLCRAAGIPESRINSIPVPFMGRKIPEAGDRPEFADWVITVINDEDFLIRNAMEAWHEAINSKEDNVRLLGSSSPSLYKVDARIQQLSRKGVVLREYTMEDAWPTQITGIRTDWNASDTIEEFNVSFKFTNWKITGGNTGNGGQQ